MHQSKASEAFQALFKDPTLTDHLHQQGYENVLVMGAMANYCCTETAISSALKGFKTTIATDRVLGWDRPLSTVEERLDATMVWRHEDGAAYHEAMIREKMKEITSNDPARHFTDERKEQIAAIKLQSFDNFMSDLAMDQTGRPGPRTANISGTTPQT